MCGHDGRSGEVYDEWAPLLAQSVAHGDADVPQSTLGTVQGSKPEAVCRSEAHRSRADRGHRPARASRTRQLRQAVGRVRGREARQGARHARRRPQEPLDGDGWPRTAGSQVRNTGDRGLRQPDARHAGRWRESHGGPLHGRRGGRLGPDRVDADPRFRARGQLQQGNAGQGHRVAQRETDSRSVRSARPDQAAQLHPGHRPPDARGGPHGHGRSQAARHHQDHRDPPTARGAVHEHVASADAGGREARRRHRNHRGHCQPRRGREDPCDRRDQDLGHAERIHRE